ncbi:MAG: hypothetical protein IT301_14745 [Dehalococcoidia bacterium]|nr:hypothetical protein [Dehalococcoidia bacterium]
MRILILAVLALGLAGALVVGAASATAQEADDTLGQLPIPDPTGWIPKPLGRDSRRLLCALCEDRVLWLEVHFSARHRSGCIPRSKNDPDPAEAHR